MADIFDIFRRLEAEKKQDGQAAASGAPITWIVAALGNPGDQYDRTRHNAGFMFMSYFSQKHQVRVNRSKFKALVGETQIAGQRVLLMMPQTFMNCSGEAIRDAAQFYKIPPEHVVVVHDDVSLDVGRMRIRLRGSDGGHNGLKNIIYHLESDAFPRIKLGVGAPPPERDMISWVLGTLDHADEEAFYSCIEKTDAALELIIGGDPQKAMNLYN